MKKAVALLVVLALTLSLVGCGDQNKPDDSQVTPTTTETTTTVTEAPTAAMTTTEETVPTVEETTTTTKKVVITQKPTPNPTTKKITTTTKKAVVTRKPTTTTTKKVIVPAKPITNAPTTTTTKKVIVPAKPITNAPTTTTTKKVVVTQRPVATTTAHVHSFSDASCLAPSYCLLCGATSGSALGHNFVSGVCSRCDYEDPDYVKVYTAGETWKVAGQFEITIDKVDRHFMCDDGYDKLDTDHAILIYYSYKNLGYDTTFSVDKYDFEVYDSTGEQGDELYFANYCDHGKDAGNAIVGGKASAVLPVALCNASNSVTILMKIDYTDYTATFNIPVTDPPPAEEEPEEDKWNGCTFTVNETLPQTFSYTHSGYSFSNYADYYSTSCSVTDVSFEVSGDDLYIYFSGRKTYDSRGSGQSDSCYISWKLYDADTNTVVGTGTASTLSLAEGEGFSKTKETAYNCIEPGKNYLLKLLNTN